MDQRLEVQMLRMEVRAAQQKVSMLRDALAREVEVRKGMTKVLWYAISLRDESKLDMPDAAYLTIPDQGALHREIVWGGMILTAVVAAPEHEPGEHDEIIKGALS